jgi:hypothetical protein
MPTATTSRIKPITIPVVGLTAGLRGNCSV